MATLGDVKAAWQKLQTFRANNQFYLVNCANLSVEEAAHLTESMNQRLQLSDEATKLFLEIGKQFCTDNGFEWGKIPQNYDRDAALSEEAKSKLVALLNFMERNS